MNNRLKHRCWRASGTALGMVALGLLLAGCASPEPVGVVKEWNGYQKWYRVTKTPNTGDPSGFLQKRHNGTKAYRVIYINAIGEPVSRSMGPYKYPTGTVIVKETYKNKKRYEAGTSKVLTIMIKGKEGSAPSTGDWTFVMGDTMRPKKRGAGMETKWGKFCGSCHINAVATDYAFMNTKFFKEHGTQ